MEWTIRQDKAHKRWFIWDKSKQQYLWRDLTVGNIYEISEEEFNIFGRSGSWERVEYGY